MGGAITPLPNLLENEMKELIIGCGQHKKKILLPPNKEGYENPVTLDINPNVKPDIVHDLEVLPLPFDDNEFDEIHAYEVLEHTGEQGDYKFFFKQFIEFWRILKQGGLFCATVPTFDSMWAWGDPSHKRIINQGTLVFLSQDEYIQQIDEGGSPMTDFRYIYKADFKTVHSDTIGNNYYFILQKVNNNE